MLDSWLMQLRLFPRQFWQAVQTLAQQVLVGLMALVMPLVLVDFGLELSSRVKQASPHRPLSALSLETWRNLSHPLTEAKPETLPTRDQSDRRGPMQEWRTGQVLEWLPVQSSPAASVVSVSLDPLRQGLSFYSLPLQPQPWTYQTLLPNWEIFL